MTPVIRAQEHGIKLSGTRFKISERKYFSQAAHNEALELVLQDAEGARSMNRLRKARQGPLSVRPLILPLLRVGSGSVAEGALLSAVLFSVGCQPLLAPDNSLVPLRAQKAALVSSVFPSSTVSAIKP